MSWRLILCVCGGALLLRAPLRAAETNLVKLTWADGTTLEGPVVAEDDQQISLQLTLAGGTIMQTRTFRKADLAGITRFGEAELATRAMERAYETLARYRLDPSTSYAATYYRQVIDNAFRPFLARYPDSPHAQEVEGQIAQWEAEYQQVAEGKAKYLGHWMPTAEAIRFFEQEHGQQVLNRARELVRQRQFPQALELVRPLASPQAHALQEQAYRQWLAALEKDHQRLGRDLQRYQSQAASAQEQISRAQSALRSPPKPGEPSATAAYSRAADDLRMASAHVASLQQQLGTVERSITNVQARAATVGLALGAPATGAATAQPAAAPEPEDYGSPSLLRNIAKFFRDYWQILTIASLVGIWLITRQLAK